MGIRNLHSDETLVRQTLQGHKESYNLLVQRHMSTAYAVAYAQCGNRADAEDYMQEAFIKAYESLSSLREGGRFVPWLLMIVRRTCVDSQRRTLRRTGIVEAQGPAETSYRIEGELEKREMEVLLRRQLEALRPEQREVLVMHYFAGQRVRQIAAALDLKPQAVAKRLQRAREALGEQMLGAVRGHAQLDDAAVDAHRQRIAQAVAFMQPAWAPVSAGGVLSQAGLSAASLLAPVWVKAVLAAGMGLAAVGAWRLWDMESSPQETALNVPKPSEAFSQNQDPPENEAPLAPGMSAVSGHALDATTGKPIAGGLVLLRDRRTFENQAEAPTGQGGRFSLRNVPPGSYVVELTRAGGVPLPPGSRPRTELRLGEGESLTGLVLDTTGYNLPWVGQ